MNLGHKIDKRLVKANKEYKTYLDIFEVVTQDIFDAVLVFRQQIGAMSEEEEAKVLKDTTDLAEQLRDEGTDLITQLTNLDDLGMLQSKGGNSFLVRHLPDGWGNVPSGFESYHDIEDLQDLMFQVRQTEPTKPRLECRPSS